MQNMQSLRVADNLFSMAQEPQSGLGRLVFKSDRISHTIRHTQTHLVALSWMSDQLVAEADIYTKTKDERRIS